MSDGKNPPLMVFPDEATLTVVDGPVRGGPGYRHLTDLRCTVVAGWYRIGGKNTESGNKVVALLPSRDRNRAATLWRYFTGRTLPTEVKA